MKICCREMLSNAGWKRSGSKISYEPEDEADSDGSYCLRFSYSFKTATDAPGVEFAYCFPYTYTRLIRIVHALRGYQKESLGKTYEGRSIPMLTIGNPDSDHSLVFSARVHPGETVSSFIMEGFLRALSDQHSEYATLLRETFLIRVVPMLNPDGVVRGNYRFSASGFDLNRKWLNPKQQYQP